MTMCETTKRIASVKRQEREEENRELVDLYARIANIEIVRAAKSGYVRTIIHFNPCIKKELEQVLSNSGYSIRASSIATMMVSWEE